MTHLRKYLEDTGALAPESLDAALRRQQIYGGSLDTVILELDIVDPLTLNELLNRACGLPVAPYELLAEADERPWEAIPEELVEIGWAVPLRYGGGDLIVGVHPDLPNERLGALYREVPGVQPMVTPECCVEKIAATRSSSVVPQRYAILAASYANALRRRPSISDIDYPVLPVRPTAPSEEDTHKGPAPSGPSTHAEMVLDEGSIPEGPDTLLDADTKTFEPLNIDDPAAPAVTLDGDDSLPAGVPTFATFVPSTASAGAPTDTLTDDQHSAPFPVASTEPEPDPPHPLHPLHDDAALLGGSDPVGDRSGDRDEPVVHDGAPPVRFSARGTVISSEDRLQARFEEAEAQRRMAGARESLRSASDREALLEALVQAAMVVTPRVALFRVVGETLEALAVDASALPIVDGAEVDTGDDVGAVLVQRRWVGETINASLQQALGYDDVVPCLMCRIDVAERPVLVLYADHGGREFLPAEANALGELSHDAGLALAALLDRSAKARSGRAVAPPPSFAGDDVPWSNDPIQRADSETLGYVVDAVHAPDVSAAFAAGVPTEATFEERITITEDAPLPPPPGLDESIVGVDAVPPDDTLPGVPRPTPMGMPRFVPPPLEAGRESSGIIPLSSPIDQPQDAPTARGRIALDDEDWAPPPPNPIVSEAEIRRIDAALEDLARGEGDLQAIKDFGEPGLERLAAQFPGPLEVLRRDLRALPPPSAHGPFIRAAITIGAPFVPHVIELFKHPEPDVRFYAAFVFQELRDPGCLVPLSTLAFDGSGDVRVIAMRVLETFNRFEGFSDAVSTIRDDLDSPNRTRQLYAARAVGTLRDVGAIDKLVELLSSKDRFIQEAALESLCSITGQQFGLKPHRWKSWHRDNQGRHRVEWIIDSLRHRDLPVRRWAHDELVRVTGHRVPFSPLGDRQSRDVAARAWTDWWLSTGRQRLAGS